MMISSPDKNIISSIQYFVFYIHENYFCITRIYLSLLNHIKLTPITYLLYCPSSVKLLYNIHIKL